MPYQYSLNNSKSNTSFHGLAVKILKENKKPMSVSEILNEIKKSKKISGKTPDATLRSALIRSRLIKRVKLGIYSLK